MFVCNILITLLFSFTDNYFQNYCVAGSISADTTKKLKAFGR
jgi:hypothetical protein